MNDDARRDPPRGRRWLFPVLAILLGVSAAGLAVEATLRVFPLVREPEVLDILIEPGGKYQAPDPALGFTPLPGRYKALFDHRYPWTLTNLTDTTRITRPLERYENDPPKPGVWVFGCSFTQGWGLDDEGTMPWKLQERLPSHDVVNFGVGGYGTLQSLLQYRRALKERPTPPRAAVLVYADFHDQRNVRTDAWRDANFNFERFGTTAQPYARLDWSGNLRYGWGSSEVPLMWLRAHSKAVNVAAIGYGKLREPFLREHRVSELLIQEFVEESHKHGVKFVLAGIWPSEGTSDTLRSFGARGVTTLDISTDQKDQRNLIPYDGHPSAFANEQSAEKLAEVLREDTRQIRSQK